MDEYKPKLRNVEIRPVTHAGEDRFLFRDHHGVAQDVMVPQALGTLLSLFDGTRTTAELIDAYAGRSGERLPDWFVQKIVIQLDDAYLLDSPRFAAHRDSIWCDFIEAPTRPATLAGLSYPEQLADLCYTLAGYFEQATRLASGAPLPPIPASRVRGIMVPHIDFMRGGPVEALAYQQLTDTYDVFVILGIAHCGVRYPFCAAAKDYETPLGTARVDTEFVENLRLAIGDRLTAEQFAHKHEHSVEFVTVFLQYLEHLRPARIVPILCGGFHEEVRRRVSPRDNPDVAQFCNALRNTVLAFEARGQRVGLIASVDMAHVGPNFDPDEPAVGKSKLRAIEAADREFLGYLEAGDAEGMHAHIARDDNARNIDAHPALYTLLTAFPELRARLLYYTYAPAPSNSIVSFASMTLYDGA